MGLDRILADEQPLCDLTVAETLSNEAQNLKLARCNAKGVKLSLIEGEGDCCISRDDNLAKDDLLARFRELDPKPDAERGEEYGDQSPIDLERVLDHQELVLGPPKDNDENAADEAENQNVAEEGTLHLCWVDSTVAAYARLAPEPEFHPHGTPLFTVR